MTALVVRSPLQSLSMTSTQRPAGRRRSARLAFQDDEPVLVAPVKRVKTGPSGNAKANDLEEVNGINGAGNKAESKGKTGAARGRAAKSASYEEEDDGFTFSRGRSRKTAKKPTTAPVREEPEPEPEPAPPKASKPVKPAPSEPAKKSRTTKKSLAAIAPAVADEIEPGPKRRRSARLSGDNVATNQPPPVATPAAEKPKRTRKSAVEKEARTPKSRAEEDEGLALVGQNGAQPQSDQPSREGTKIALPFADTPIIKRNKELRKGGGSGHRRSSTGLRGRRASSLIDSGTSNAVPHAEVATEEFYKLIEDSLPEPRRMKQLLVWCGTRALPEKPSGDVPDSSAIMAARAIQQELLNDFASKSEMSNWFDREEVEPTAVVKKPNPRNQDNAKRLEELEAEVKRLQEEKKSWEKLLKKPEALSSRDTETLPDAPPSDTASGSSVEINPSLLGPEQASILQQLKDLNLNLAFSANAASSSKPPAPASEPSTSIPQATDEPHKTAEATADPTHPSTASHDPSSSSTVPQPPTTTPAPPTQQQKDIHTRLRTITASLPAQADLFADGVHKLAQYRAAADRVADAVLASAAQRLEQRDREARERAGTAAVGGLDVLRGLAGVLSGGAQNGEGEGEDTGAGDKR
ncbi:kinetochore protein-like protein Mis13 [Phyllosticta citriasiana]|uniref:Kinetochore protein-like protein Mis13 n=1 Tax=Phyllosticta citriasiana TaxID=595635 RepID=A0ABR1KJZ5_9PEZI